MRSTIIMGGEAVIFEATAGTAELFQLFTGKNILSEMYEFRAIAELLEKKEADDITPEDLLTILPAMQLLQKLAFVMNMQAIAEGATPLDKIRWTKAQLNEDGYIAWLSTIDASALDMSTLIQIMNLWSSQTNGTVQAKN